MLEDVNVMKQRSMNYLKIIGKCTKLGKRKSYINILKPAGRIFRQIYTTISTIRSFWKFCEKPYKAITDLKFSWPVFKYPISYLKSQKQHRSTMKRFQTDSKLNCKNQINLPTPRSG